MSFQTTVDAAGKIIKSTIAHLFLILQRIGGALLPHAVAVVHQLALLGDHFTERLRAQAALEAELWLETQGE